MIRFTRRHLRLNGFVFVALLFMAGIAAAVAQETDLHSPVQKLELSDGDCLVFLGDSITHQCLYTQYVEDYFYTRFPHMRLKFHNAGVGGAQAWDALQRFDRDVAAYKPKYVTVLLGMNDGQYRPFNSEVFAKYHKDMSELNGRIEGIGARPILMTPTMFDARVNRLRAQPGRGRSGDMLEQYNGVLAYFGAWLRDVAVEQGYGFVDAYSPLNNLTLQARTTNPKFTMIPDSVHPAPPGQLVMAYAIIRDMGLPTSVSSIRLQRKGDGSYRQRADGGTISELTASDQGVNFKWLANSLPWVVPKEAELGAELLHLGPHMNRETLEVYGLAPGRYELLIDGQVIGTHSSVELARGIKLQDVKETPQYQQALQVAERNKERNAGPVRSLRNQWSQFQQYSRLKLASENQPDNAKRADQIAKLENNLKGLEDRIAKFEKQAKEAEDRIFEVNQPAKHDYELTRVN